MFGRYLESTSQLYTIAADTESVKVEASDDGFIQDVTHRIGSSAPAPFEHLVPPTEVPLRATGATKEMRKLMSVFRLNPFSIHHGGGRGVSDPLWNGEEAGPLTEKPQYFEYQLNGYYDNDDEMGDRAHGNSPGLSLHILDGDEESGSPWTGSDEHFDSSSGWQAADWSSHVSHSSPSDMNGCLELEYTESMRLPCKL